MFAEKINEIYETVQKENDGKVIFWFASILIRAAHYLVSVFL